MAGPAIGGVIVDALGWQYVFFLNIPLGLLGLAAAMAILQESKASPESVEAGPKFDWLGAALSSAALITLLLAMTNGPRSGWLSPPILVAASSCAALFGGFIWWELRTPNPMLDLRLFARKTFSFGVSAAFFTFLGSSAVLFLMPFYLQGVLGYSPRTAGLIVMPGAVCMALIGPISGGLSDRYGWRLFTVGGLLCSSCGLFLLSRLTETSSLAMVFPPLILMSSGMGMFYSPNASSVLSSVEMEKYGIVSGLLNLVRNGANIVSLAMATAIVTATMASLGFEPSLDAVEEAAQAGIGHAFTVGLRNAVLVMMGLVLIGAALSAFKGQKALELETASPA